MGSRGQCSEHSSSAEPILLQRVVMTKKPKGDVSRMLILESPWLISTLTFVLAAVIFEPWQSQADLPNYRIVKELVAGYLPPSIKHRFIRYVSPQKRVSWQIVSPP